ncbi:MAG TPA: hypothetical protein VGB25_06285, partial [Candidatus Binatia bacterium]
DPWRMQYFEGVACPENVIIPTDDEYAYVLYPAHRWVYNKLLLCETQGLEHAPHGPLPPSFPVFSKPIYNLRGMGAGCKLIESAEQYELEQDPGSMWMPLLNGEHVSSDAALVDGKPLWWRHTVAKALEKGMFDYWTVHAEPHPAIESHCGAWLEQHLRGYSGVVNLETIGGTIIECHLRLADQWVDLNGPGWLDSVVELYVHKRWSFADEDRRTGYSICLFGGHGLRYRKVDRSAVAELRTRPGLSSIQITFHEDKPPKAHAMPPGGFRLAVINCWDLEAGLKVRDALALMFWSTQKLRVKRAGRP